MRAFEPEPGETRSGGRPWTAFKVFRDLGPQRRLKAVAAVIYNRVDGEPKPHQYVQVRKWSAEFDWQARAQAFDDWQSLIGREAIEEHLRSKAAEFVERQQRLREILLRNAEIAADQARKMLEWPLTEQRVVNAEDGGEVTYVFMPAGWSKATARSMFELAASAVTDAWTTARPGEEEDELAEFDYSQMTEGELQTFLELWEKVTVAPRRRPRDG